MSYLQTPTSFLSTCGVLDKLLQDKKIGSSNLAECDR